MRPIAFSAACVRHGRAPPQAPQMSKNSSLSFSCSIPGKGVILDWAAVHVDSQKHVQCSTKAGTVAIILPCPCAVAERAMRPQLPGQPRGAGAGHAAEWGCSWRCAAAALG